MSSHPPASVLQSEVDRLRLQLHTLQVEQGVQNISIGNYLLERLAQLGVTVRWDLLLLPINLMTFTVNVWCSRRFQFRLLGE